MGVDGGGSRATALVCDVAGGQLARIDGGPGILHSGKPEARAADLARLVVDALQAAGAEPPAETACFALAGAGRGPERGALRQALTAEGIARRVLVITDAEAALEDAFGAGPGLLVISGTGSIAWGRAEDGRQARTGGWGGLLGDEGSGYHLGICALRAAVRAHDGRGTATVLLDSIIAHTGVSRAEDLIAWVDGAEKHDVAAMAPLLLEAAVAGDDVSLGIAGAAAHDLVNHVEALYSRLQPWSRPPGLALAGGLLCRGRPFRGFLLERIERFCPQIDIIQSDIDAARGATVRARRRN